MPAQSKAQQRLMGMAWAVRKGKLARNKVNKEVLDIADSDISDEDLEHFASTKHKSLKESLLESLLDNPEDQITQEKIKIWIKKNHFRPDGDPKFVINDDLTIDIKQFTYSGDGDFPEYIQFNKCEESFLCDDCDMTSLRGCPQWVGEAFNCSHNYLKTLEGGPQWVGGNYACQDNELKSLKGCAEHVGKKFKCYNNKLRSLKYGPKFVGIDYIVKGSDYPQDENPIPEKEIRDTIARVCKQCV